MLKISADFISELSQKAKENPRKRLHHNFHKDYREKVQRLLNACGPNSYFRPHCHADSGVTESIILIRGKLVVVEFNMDAEIVDHFILEAGTGNVGVELPPECWHTMIALEENTVMYEIKEGPFDPNRKKQFAEWAPEEGSETAASFNAETLKKLKISGF
jgi:cupin fold WbuC family metalloprotein